MRVKNSPFVILFVLITVLSSCITEDRDDCSLKFYLYTPSPEEIEKYFRQKLSDVLYALEVDKVPKMVTTEDISLTEVVSTTKVCNYCPYKKQCGRDLNV